jgi:hypothetical protein
VNTTPTFVVVFWIARIDENGVDIKEDILLGQLKNATELNLVGLHGVKGIATHGYHALAD